MIITLASIATGAILASKYTAPLCSRLCEDLCPTRTSAIASNHGAARQTAQRCRMTSERAHAKQILVTGAAGAVGSIGRNLTEMLLAKGHKVRALVRREDERAEALRRLGAEVMQGDLTELTAMHRAIEGCARVYFGMSVSADYLTATVNTAAVARHQA